MKNLFRLPIAALALAAAFCAHADPLNVQATMVPKEQIKLDFRTAPGTSS
jgi:hypothetical protein